MTSCCPAAMSWANHDVGGALQNAPVRCQQNGACSARKLGKALLAFPGGDGLGEGNEVSRRILVSDFAHTVEGRALRLHDLGTV